MADAKGPPPTFTTTGGRTFGAKIARSMVAYRTVPTRMNIVPAPADRQWMEESRQRFANRCLPLLMANQAGWLILNDQRVEAAWNGGIDQASLSIKNDGPESLPRAVSHFGHGIISFHIPFLFRTPPGYNVLARGPANLPRDGVQALEGVVETDWAVATFTMNWKITRPDFPVIFEPGDPICMIVPQRRGELEEFWPQTTDLAVNKQLYEAHDKWRTSRADFIKQLKAMTFDESKTQWQKHYFQGKTPGGAEAPQHQTKLELRPFEEMAITPTPLNIAGIKPRGPLNIVQPPRKPPGK
jgi:hypothetical protein